MDRLNDYLNRSAESILAIASQDFSDQMQQAAALITTALGADKPLLVCGNGGSAADALHIAGELVGRFLRERKGYHVIALPADVSTLTAWSNDYSFDTVYARQVESHGREGGVLLGISTSGNSTNVVLAAEAAKKAGMAVIGMTGQSGGKLAPLCDVLFNVPSDFTPITQQGHLCLYHHLCDLVEEGLADAGTA